LAIIVIDVLLKRLISEWYTRHPLYASRKMVVHLERCGNRSTENRRSA